MTAPLSDDRLAWTLLAGIVAGVVALRVLLLAGSGLNLHPDEAQYWSWSREPAWGYHTKPPLIAWIIAASGQLCGSAEWCVRSASPVLHGATSLLTALCAARLFGAATGFWTGVLVLTLPGIAWSSFLMSTDVPLLACWAAALYFLLRLLGKPGPGWAFLLGLAIGLGLLAKYAMAYFPLCLLLACLAYREHRWLLTSRQLAIALLVAAAIASPNLVWNMANDWATVAHVGDNASLSGPLFHPDSMARFVTSQAGVFGPILFAVLLWRAVALLRGRARPFEGLLLCFSLPILAIVTLQALLSRANANWAAPAFVSGTVVVAAWAVSTARRWVIGGSVALHVAAAAVMSALLLEIPGVSLPLASDPLDRLRGWDETVSQVSAAARANPGRILLTDDRKTMAALLYYGRNEPLRPRMWNYDGRPDHHYELVSRYRPRPGDRVMLVARWEGHHLIVDAFDTVRPLDVIRVPLGQERERVLHLYALDAVSGT